MGKQCYVRGYKGTYPNFPRYHFGAPLSMPKIGISPVPSGMEQYPRVWKNMEFARNYTLRGRAGRTGHSSAKEGNFAVKHCKLNTKRAFVSRMRRNWRFKTGQISPTFAGRKSLYFDHFLPYWWLLGGFTCFRFHGSLRVSRTRARATLE